MLDVLNNNKFIKTALLIILLGGILLINPQKLNSDSNQSATEIKKEIDLVNEGITNYILDNEYEVPGQNIVSFDNTIKDAMDEGRLFDSMGLVKEDHKRVNKNTYFELSDKFINSQIDTPLSGLFISTNNGDILYIQK